MIGALAVAGFTRGDALQRAQGLWIGFGGQFSFEISEDRLVFAMKGSSSAPLAITSSEVTANVVRFRVSAPGEKQVELTFGLDADPDRLWFHGVSDGQSSISSQTIPLTRMP